MVQYIMQTSLQRIAATKGHESPRNGLFLSMMAYATTKDNKMKVLKKDSKAWALALKIAKRKYMNREPVELLDGERV